ncbi:MULTISPECIES: hypothetical protein [unclassified Pseudonocardia]|uniref:hypothetical protein n=1 Tax=unclassified Pseudonocardia TaxID=2619320 RepID=UPI001CF6A856|nr:MULTISPECIES: hypothetical protein [unclassified Pseudonocardia]
MSAPNPWLGRPRAPRPPPAPDPDAVRLVGLPRRRAAARAVNDVVRGVDVRAFGDGWTVSFLSGHYTLCHTLDELLDAVAPSGERELLRATVLAAADGSAGRD